MQQIQPSPPWLSEIIFRPATQADLPALEWEGEYTHFRRVFRLAMQDVRSGSAILWLAVLPEDASLLGQVFVQLHSRGRPELADGRQRAYLYAIRVKSGFRNAGLGNLMMDFVETDLAQRRYRYATLNVARDNPSAYRFYTRRGYRMVAPEPGQWSYIDHRGMRQHVNEPAWRMEKTLPGLDDLLPRRIGF
jgi:ribosomal protein S18 acetylase RimI-like enzyme